MRQLTLFAWELTGLAGWLAGSSISFLDVFRNPGQMFEWTDVGFMAVPAVIATPSSLLVLIFMVSFIVIETYDVLTTNRDDDFAKFVATICCHLCSLHACFLRL
jgi:hypothetical protein